jgi:TatD DNase family protein
MLIDSHAHLNDKRLLPELHSIIADMPKDNLEAIINVGYDLPSSKMSVDIAQHDGVFAAVGIHPHDAKDASQQDYDYFAQAATNKKVVAVGEIGLDFYYDHSPRKVQQRVFLEQLELADGLALPVIIHLRDAYQPMLELLKQNKQKLKNGAILHCYSGSAEMMREYAKLGLYFSYGGAITFKNATEKPRIVAETPIEKLLIETDCPYMTPEPHRGRLNYPKYVSLVAQKVALYTNRTYEEIAEITRRNTKELFGRMNKEG